MTKEYLIGVMITPIETSEEAFHKKVEEAVRAVEQILSERVPNLAFEVFDFIGPHLRPQSGAYSPLELLQLGVIEKVERKLNFLLVVTEVGISAHLTTYSVALPSPLTNVGIISVKRLDPRFWDSQREDDTTPQRLVATRTRRVAESLVVTNVATLLTLFLTMLVLYAAFWVLVYIGVITLFPQRLMETWPTVDPATRTLDHVKISTFIAAMGTLVGSLGGRVENEAIMRRILFIDVNY